jgi:MFS family permease
MRDAHSRSISTLSTTRSGYERVTDTSGKRLFFPGVIFYLTLWYPSDRRSTRTAWFVSAIALAGVIGNPTSGAIMDNLSGVLGLAGWQWLFLAEGIPSIIVGFWVLSYLDSRIDEAK